MLTIVRLRLKNWKCFAGEQVLELGPRPYAVVARQKGDPDRSNWLGKSSLLEAVDYAVSGRLPETCRRKQDWVTEGEKAGEVDLTLSDGSRIVRSLARGGSERLFFFPAGRPTEGSVQDEAQKAIDRLRGLSESDDLATWYFQQGRMSRLVRCEPSERMGLVVSWMGLERVEECEAHAIDVLSELVRRREAAQVLARAHQAHIGQILEKYGIDSMVGLAGLAAHAVLVAEQTAAVLEASQQAGGRLRERTVLEAAATRYVLICQEGKQLAGEARAAKSVDQIRGELVPVLGELRRVGALRQDAGVGDVQLVKLRRLAEGRFDGVCPVVNQDCPSCEFVRGQTESHQRVYEETAQLRADLDAEYAKVAAAQTALEHELRVAERRDDRLRSLREEARALAPQHARYLELEGTEDEEVWGRLTAAQSSHEEARTRAQELKGAVTWLEGTVRQRDDATVEGARLEGAVRTASAAALIFGKAGAQRRIAEQMLEEVEGRANELFAECAINLQVRVRWSREGAGLAQSCPKCGEAFPASAKAKECRRCGEKRGPNLVNRLEVEGTNRSGAADDLVGGFLQLAASEWLRADRRSEWGVCALDEPFGQMDPANRRAFAAHLPGVLRRVGFEQAFVIAHHAGPLDALPGRICIESDGKRSTATVVG